MIYPYTGLSAVPLLDLDLVVNRSHQHIRLHRQTMADPLSVGWRGRQSTSPVEMRRPLQVLWAIIGNPLPLTTADKLRPPPFPLHVRSIGRGRAGIPTVG